MYLRGRIEGKKREKEIEIWEVWFERSIVNSNRFLYICLELGVISFYLRGRDRGLEREGGCYGLGSREGRDVNLFLIFC